jgi:hypothetical protein
MPRDMTGAGRYAPQPRFPPFAFYSAVRLADPGQLALIMATDPYFVTQDNGAGAPLHFATTYRQLDMVRPCGSPTLFHLLRVDHRLITHDSAQTADEARRTPPSMLCLLHSVTCMLCTLRHLKRSDCQMHRQKCVPDANATVVIVTRRLLTCMCHHAVQVHAA